MEPIQVLLGKKLRQYRIMKAYSLEELSHKAGLNTAHLGKIERGERNFTVESLDKIVRALDLSYSQIFEFEAPALPSNGPIIEKTLSYLNTLTLEEQNHIYQTVRILSEKK